MNIKLKIANVSELDEVGELKDSSISAIENIIKEDHAISMIPDECYDAIIVSSNTPNVDSVVWGLVFFNKKKLFSNGTFIRTTRIKEIAIPIDGLKLVHTLNTRYLVI